MRATILSAAFLLVFPTFCVSHADETEIRRAIGEFFTTQDPQQRPQLVERIKNDAAYAPEKVRAWLHDAVPFQPFHAGVRTVHVDVPDGKRLAVRVRIPEDYDAKRPWPLIYVLHGLGGNADGVLRYALANLGPRANEFILAAPHGYQQVLIHSSIPPAPEHTTILRAVKQTVHVDSRRVYVLGYSRGGHTAWMLAMSHPDQFAGIVPVAGTLLLPEYDELFKLFLPNVANTRVLACWGENDIMSADNATPSEDGGIAGLNRKLVELAQTLELPLEGVEFPGKGHGDILPPPDKLQELLTAQRTDYPAKVRQVFRLPYQTHVYWLEAHRWAGKYWDNNPLRLTYKQDESEFDPLAQRAALARAVRQRLGELRGEVEGQEIRVYRKGIREFTVWIGEEMIDWSQPVTLLANGRKVFEGKLERDLYVCLSQAARTYDLDRLRWAGLRFRSGHRTKLVDHETEFPTPTIPEN